MLGALEALNGMLLFGLTTAFLYAAIRNVHDVMMSTRAAAAAEVEAVLAATPPALSGSDRPTRIANAGRAGPRF